MNRLFLCGITTLLAAQLFSEQINDTSAQTSRPDNNLSIGVSYTYVTIQPEGMTTTHGNLGGLEGVYEYLPMDGVYAAAKLAWRQGPLDSTSSMTRNFLDLKAEERVGYTFGFKRDNYWDDFLTLYLGFGFRWMESTLKISSGSSLHQSYYDYYAPIGFLSNFSINSYFSIGCDFAWMAQVDPTLHVSPIGGARWSIDYEFLNFAVSVPLKFKVYDNLFISLVPAYEHWENGATTAHTTGGVALGVPKSVYNLYSAYLVATYSF
jgi:hypothetical protein